MFVFLLLGRGGGGYLFAAVWFGPGACLCVFAVGAGNGTSLTDFTHLPVCLARLLGAQQQKRTNSKKKTRDLI